ncbi:threonine/serine dehydratase [Candidatus Acetothermia bacterium]|nr:MAG: threonine/serine dehydratase [Candidatus Acetothermia bacterium]
MELQRQILVEVLRARARLHRYLPPTPLTPSPDLSRATGGRVYLKHENLQPTGSFKVRGALNALLALPSDLRGKGVIAASTGNHGAAVAWGASRLSIPCTVYVPRGAEPEKLENIGRWGAEVREVGDDCLEAELAAREAAKAEGRPYIPPYNDPRVIGGQGTLAAELWKELPELEAVYVPLGGGGLLSGVAAYLKAVNPQVRVVGCSPENSQVMIRSIQAGRILELPSLPTLSDGTAGGIEPGSITFDLCRALADDFLTVTEEEIATALRSFLRTHHQLIEGAAAVAVAALLRDRGKTAGRTAVVVLSGANIGLAKLRGVLGA